MSGKHSAQTVSDGIHVSYSYSYADTSARTGASGFVTADIGKFARQTDDNTIWILTATAPTWIELGSGASSNSFATINCPAGTDPVADSSTDTLNLTSTDSSVTITGTASTDTVNLAVPTKTCQEAHFSDLVGQGSGNTKVLHYGTEENNNVTTCGTVADDSTLGWVFTATANCLVNFSASHHYTSYHYIAFFKNLSDTEKDTAVTSLSAAKRVSPMVQSINERSGTAGSCVMASGDDLVCVNEGLSTATTLCTIHITVLEL